MDAFIKQLSLFMIPKVLPTERAKLFKKIGLERVVAQAMYTHINK
jgi:hypothetical protein